MMENKDPSSFIKQFKGVSKFIQYLFMVKKLCTSKNFTSFAKKQSIRVVFLKSFEQALKKISNKEKKTICVFGSLYQCGNILGKN